jgi:hypothetical protein
LFGGALEQHAGHVPPGFARGVDIAFRIEITIERTDCGIEIAAAERRFSVARPHRRCADAKEYEANVSQ